MAWTGVVKLIRQINDASVGLAIGRFSSATTANFFECRDETGTVIVLVGSNGHIQTTYMDLNANFQPVEFRLLNSDAGGEFRLYNVGAGGWHFRSFFQSFNVPGNSYTNGASMVPLQLRGRKTTTGAPTTGTWVTGDTLMDSAKVWWLCTAGGTPGTWV